MSGEDVRLGLFDPAVSFASGAGVVVPVVAITARRCKSFAFARTFDTLPPGVVALWLAGVLTALVV